MRPAARSVRCGQRRLILRNARLGLRGHLTDVTLAGGRVVSLERTSAVTEDDDLVDVDGRTLLPALWDAHVHFGQWASRRSWLDLSAARSAREAADLVADAAGSRPQDGPDLVRGTGVRDSLWDEPPHKDLLERVMPGRAIVLQTNDLHTAWFSPAALALVGAADHPTGVLKESACHRAMAALPAPSDDQLDRLAADAAAAAAARGVTGFLDLEFADNVSDWTRRAHSQPLDVRVSCGVMLDDLDAAIARGLRTGAVVDGTDGLVQVGPLKLFVDGALGSRTALCHDPYTGGEPDYRGVLVTSPDELERTMALAADHGLECAVHAIGDNAMDIALTAFERVGGRGRIEHAQLLPNHDRDRLACPGLTLGVQPAHLLDDRDIAEHYWADRTDRAYAYRDMLAAGATIELGSDAPVSPLDPWLGIAAAVTRGGDGREPWHPEQSIPLADALAAASGGRREVEVGDPADLVLLDDDPSEGDPMHLGRVGVAGTLLDGRWTHAMLDTGIGVGSVAATATNQTPPTG